MRLTVRLPHHPGVYWFTDAAGHVLYVGKATDLQTRVRSYFTDDRRRQVGPLLRQLHAVHHRICPGPLTAAVTEGRLIRTWSPPFNQERRGRSGRRRSRRARGPSPPRRPGGWAGVRAWTPEQLAADPAELLAPLAQLVDGLAGQQRYEEAAAIRDEAERLRVLLERHRRTEALRAAGRVVLEIDGEGHVVLEQGVWVRSEARSSPPSGRGTEPDRAAGLDADLLPPDQHDHERSIVAQWLAANAEAVRILEVESPSGLGMPARRIPELTELCTRTHRPGSSEPRPRPAGVRDRIGGLRSALTRLGGRRLPGDPDQGLRAPRPPGRRR